jgi:hypothetical protein
MKTETQVHITSRATEPPQSRDSYQSTEDDTGKQCIYLLCSAVHRPRVIIDDDEQAVTLLTPNTSACKHSNKEHA